MEIVLNLFLEFKQPKAPFKSKEPQYIHENLIANNNCNLANFPIFKNQGSSMLKAFI